MKKEIDIPTIEDSHIEITGIFCEKCKNDKETKGQTVSFPEMERIKSHGMDETTWEWYECPKCKNKITIRKEVTETFHKVKNEV